MVSEETTTEKTKTKKKGLFYNIIYCPHCGTAVDYSLLKSQDSICFECKQDMTSIVEEAGKQHKQICLKCSYSNFAGVQYCIKCGANDFKEDKLTFREKYFHRRNLVIGIISIAISVGLSCGIVFGIAAEFIIAQGIVAIILVISFTLIFAWFLFATISSLTSRR